MSVFGSRSHYVCLGLKNTFSQEISKKTLRNTYRFILPNKIIDRKKMPFSSGAGIGVNDRELTNNIFSHLDFNKIVSNEFKKQNYNKMEEKERFNKDKLLP